MFDRALERLEKAAAGLRPLEREVLILGAAEHLSNEQIAERLGITASAVGDRSPCQISSNPRHGLGTAGTPGGDPFRPLRRPCQSPVKRRRPSGRVMADCSVRHLS